MTGARQRRSSRLWIRGQVPNLNPEQICTHWQYCVDAAGVRQAGCNEGNRGNTRLDVSPRLRTLWQDELVSRRQAPRRQVVAGVRGALSRPIVTNLRAHRKHVYTASFSRGVEQSGSSLGS